ncbi:tyrosine-protein kinase Src64B-like [Mercenaria mercenaria]|uniref:tyrosine-protein kinase Src64B-like n=1 Tax=Mercenaria mercenaria TaxID=6596 RepID=UPI00234F18F0|nr:tyrosine-protein kinase Src64B-like [Mercenaria mercenaria]
MVDILCGVFEFVTVKALFEFDAVFENELSFKQGDKLDIDKDLFGQASFWWYASHQDCRKKGYIPSSFVLKDKNSLEAQDWWFNGNETDAETLLRHSSFQSGTFLVRQAIGEDSYMLSVKDIDRETDTPFISHYKIRHWKDRGYYICENRCFDNIPNLISQYSCETNGICCKLEKPCPKDPPKLPIRLYEWLKWLEVTRSSVKIGDKVPVYSFGDKCYGTFLNDRIAIKTLGDKTKPVDDLLGEACLLKDLRHKRLVQLLALCTDKLPFWMITEDVTNCDLLACLREDMGRSLQLNVLVHIASQISDAMDYLTKQKVVHRNLRACNILTGAGNKIKVSGLELAKRMYGDNCIYASDGQIPVKWTPPEAVIYNKFSAKSDVWSYGILLYEIITFGMSPYSGTYYQIIIKYRSRYKFTRVREVVGSTPGRVRRKNGSNNFLAWLSALTIVLGLVDSLV